MATASPPGVLSARTWPLRLLRSAMAAAVSLTLALAGHRLGGGGVAAGPLLALVFVVVLAVTLLLSARQLTTGQIVGLLLVGQIIIHLGCAVGNSMGEMSLAMAVGHLVATAFTAALLVWGERFLWSLAGRFGRGVLAFLLFAVSFARPMAMRSRVWRSSFALPRTNLVGSIGLRGPPVGCQ